MEFFSRYRLLYQLFTLSCFIKFINRKVILQRLCRMTRLYTDTGKVWFNCCSDFFSWWIDFGVECVIFRRSGFYLCDWAAIPNQYIIFWVDKKNDHESCMSIPICVFESGLVMDLCELASNRIFLFDQNTLFPSKISTMQKSFKKSLKISCTFIKVPLLSPWIV